MLQWKQKFLWTFETLQDSLALTIVVCFKRTFLCLLNFLFITQEQGHLFWNSVVQDKSCSQKKIFSEHLRPCRVLCHSFCLVFGCVSRGLSFVCWNSCLPQKSKDLFTPFLPLLSALFVITTLPMLNMFPRSTIHQAPKSDNVIDNFLWKIAAVGSPSRKLKLNKCKFFCTFFPFSWNLTLKVHFVAITYSQVSFQTCAKMCVSRTLLGRHAQW